MKQTEEPPSGLLTRIKNRLDRVFNKPPEDISELIQVVRSASGDAAISADLLDIIERVVRVSDLRARNIMIPQNLMVAITPEADFSEILTILTESGHSRFPVMDEHKNKVYGILLAKDLLGYQSSGNGSSFNIYDFLRPVTYIPESKRLNALLADFRENRNHMAVVVDEYGGIAGLVTIEDVLEQIVGDIEDESDIESDEMITMVSSDEFLVDAFTEIEDFNSHFNVDIEEDVETISGFVNKLAGRVPRAGEAYNHDGLTLEVVKADRRSATQLRVFRKSTPDTASPK